MNPTDQPFRRRTWFKRVAMIIGVLGTAIIALMMAFHSSPPDTWRSLELGEDRLSLIERIGDSDADMRDLKGYEAWNSGNQSYLGAKGYWHMLLNYDPEDRVSWKEIRFIPFESGGNNNWIPPQLLYRIKTASVRRTE